MIKIILTPITFTVDCINVWIAIILSLILWEERYINEIPQGKELKLTKLMWSKNGGIKN